ncbi:MAG: hypothetical protein HQL51_16900, partial [Magnetococcales bacterium]|nr:hypothetical protein [Magnetococcales bacterium]
ALSTSVAMTAHGAESPPLPEGVAPERVITNDPRTTVRGCIGQLDTPYCAVQTLIAGEMWSDQALCDQSGADTQCDAIRWGDLRRPYIITLTPLGWIQLDEAKLALLKQQDVYMKTEWRPGDVFFVTFNTAQGSDPRCGDDQVNGKRSPADFCPLAPPHPDARSDHRYRSFTLRNEGGVWKILEGDAPDRLGSTRGYLFHWLEMGWMPRPTAYYLAMSRQQNQEAWDDEVWHGALGKEASRTYSWDATPPYPVSAVEHPQPVRLPLIPDPPPSLLTRPPSLLPRGVSPINTEGAVMEAWMREEPSWEREINGYTPSSGCLGNTTTPFCTVVTYLAAEETRNAPWGRMTGVGPDQGGVDSDEQPYEEFVRLRVIPAGMAPVEKTKGVPPPMEGDKRPPGSVTLVVYLKTCREEERCLSSKRAKKPASPTECPIHCFWDSEPWGFHLAPTDAGTWEIIDYDSRKGSLPVWRYKELLPTLDRYELRASEQR